MKYLPEISGEQVVIGPGGAVYDPVDDWLRDCRVHPLEQDEGLVKFCDEIVWSGLNVIMRYPDLKATVTDRHMVYNWFATPPMEYRGASETASRIRLVGKLPLYAPTGHTIDFEHASVDLEVQFWAGGVLQAQERALSVTPTGITRRANTGRPIAGGQQDADYMLGIIRQIQDAVDPYASVPDLR